MNDAADSALVKRLRLDLELKAEMLKALQLEREHERGQARNQAALMAEVSAEMHAQATALGLLLAERDAVAAQRVAESLASVSADLLDYTAASSGELVLAREPVNIRQLLARFESRSALQLRVSAAVPERVLADQARLSKVLSCFVSEGLEQAASGALALQVTANDATGAAGVPQIVLSLLSHGADRRSNSRGAAPVATATKRLRAALAQSLCQLMGATRAPMSLILPLPGAVDQAHTGLFRIAASEAATVEPAAQFTLATDDDAAIDLLYLDRQLGSLAQPILARTAPAFIAHAQRRMTDLHVANDIEDLVRMRAIARVWKGSALSVGACTLAALLDAIERQAAAGRLPGPGPIWQVRSALDRVVRVLGNHARA
jgi:hypothetical protein